ESELLDVDRLLVEVVGAALDRGQRALASPVARGDDDLRGGLERNDLVEHCKALARAVRVRRQAEIERDDRRLLGAKGRDRARPIAGDDHVEIVVGPLELGLQALVVLDDEQLGSCFGHHATSVLCDCIERIVPAASASGSTTRNRVPSPSRDSTSSRPPIARMSSRASKAPIPKPPGFDEWNGLNSRVRMNSGLIPEPESTISTTAWASSARRSRNTGMPSG